MFRVASFVKEVTDGSAEALTGVFSLAGVPSSQFHDFVTGIGNGNATLFQVTDGNQSEAWEGTVADGDPDQLTGTRFVGSTTGSQIEWGPGVKTISCGIDGADYLGIPGASDETGLAISSGSVTPTRAQHALDTEDEAGTDDLSNIATTNMRDGRWLLIREANGSRTVVVKDAAGGAGQIHLANNADFSLDATDKWLLLVRRGADWHEVSRSFGADAAAERAFLGLGSAAILAAGTEEGDLPTVGDITETLLPTVSQEDAEAGTATDRRVWTAQRVAQAIAALGGTSIFTEFYESSAQTITNGGGLSLSPGLTAGKKWALEGVLVCTTANLNYTVGAEVVVHTYVDIDQASAGRGISIWRNGNNINVVFGQSGVLLPNASGGAVGQITNGSWALVVRGRA